MDEAAMVEGNVRGKFSAHIFSAAGNGLDPHKASSCERKKGILLDQHKSYIRDHGTYMNISYVGWKL